MDEREPLPRSSGSGWEGVDRKLDGGKDCVHDRVMVRRLFARLLVIPSNQKQLLVRTYAEDSPRGYKVVKSDWEPNPWHADPADPELIRQGKLATLDEQGRHLGVGPFPR
jgi:hypothetical protein